MTNDEKVLFDSIIEEMMMVYKFDNRPWMVGYSGGKDSTMLVKLIFQMMAKLLPEERTKPVYVITSDTMVENPIVEKYMKDSSIAINQFSGNNNMNVHSIIVKPDISQTFWSLVIGLGYPTPELPGFRWCTERLKINSMNTFTQKIIDEYKEVVLLLGVRKGESITRQKSIESKEIVGKLLNPHSTLAHTYVYNPLTEIPNRLVWEFLLENDGICEWGTNLKLLFNMYQGIDMGEEKSVLGEIDKEKIPVTGNSRFGCWCCTIVKEDKSLMNFINQGSVELIPLRDFRDWLVSIRKDPSMRDNKRRNGAVYTKANGEKGLGPFTLDSRGIILDKLLRMQESMRTNYPSCKDIELISIEELKYIDGIWEEEGDLSRRKLVDIYHSATGRKLPWDDYKTPLYSKEVILELQKAAESQDIPFELISKLLTSIEKNKHYVRGNKVQKGFDRIMSQGWLHDAQIKEVFNDEN